MVERARRFRLWKYYLDCVTEDGTACIGYVGGLRWGPLALRYAALLESLPDGTRRERHTWARVPVPAAGAEGIAWECEALGVRGTWREPEPEHEATLLEGPGGTIRWRVLAPRARARIERPLDGPVTGWGYVERLELDVEPWRLPLDTLRWGRFHSTADALVWIEWQGDAPLHHVLHNGELLGRASFGERGCSFGGGRELELGESRTVHDGPVVAALARLPRVLRRVPPSFLGAREVKWLSRARLSAGGLPPASGWALHEQVQFR